MGVKCALFDVDGTLTDCRHRRPYLLQPSKNWKAFNAAMGDDPPNRAVIMLANAISQSYVVVLVSGRNESHRRLTELWMTCHDVHHAALYLRADGDCRADHVVKRELLARIRADGYDPLFVVDDRPSVVRMWRAEGLTCLQCADDEEFNCEQA